MLIPRKVSREVETALAHQASVALIGPRQVGKTTLALQLAQCREVIYLDLEQSGDRQVLNDPLDFFTKHLGTLVVLDEVHRVPEIFAQLRGVIDRVRFQGTRHGQFLFLGSASMDLLKQSSESLAGRISFVSLNPVSVLEAHVASIDSSTLWLRGGFPDSLLAPSDAVSLTWRSNFIRTYIERDTRTFMPRVSSTLIEKLWTMLAHSQGGVVNYASLARSLSVSPPTVRNYVEFLNELLLVRILRPFQPSVRKQYVKSPKLYIRDSGLAHALLGVETDVQLRKHPVVGHSWEAFVIEQILDGSPKGTQASFYRSAKGAEIDLILDFPGLESRWAVEIKRDIASGVRKGFYFAIEDVKATKSYVVHSGTSQFSLGRGIEAIGLIELCKKVSEHSGDDVLAQ